MRSFFATLRQLVLPAGAAPGAPAIVLGPDVPTELQTFYTGLGTPVVAAIIWRVNATTYSYEAALSGAQPRATGAVVGGVVSELWQMGASGGIAQLYPSFSGVNIQIGTGTLGIGALATLAISLGGDFTINGRSQPRGLIDRVSSVANTAAIAAETVILTGNVVGWRSLRAYEVEYHQATTPNVANNFSQFLIRRTNLAGALRMSEIHSLPIAGTSITCQASGVIVNNTGATIFDNIVLTMNGGLGTNTGNGGVLNLRWMTIKDCGASADYPNAIQI